MQENETRDLSDVNEAESDKIKVELEKHCWDKMYGWCKAAKGEVSGMGLCKIVGNKFVVYEVYLPKQYGSTGYTELDDRSLAKLQMRLFQQDKNPKHFRFWWHTHYNFNVFWSGTDDDNAKRLAQANGEWELSVVINQKGEYRARVDFFTQVHRLVPTLVHTLVDELPVLLRPNSRRIRTKRNYRTDVRKWVLPMSELPESQKPKAVAYTGPVMDEYAGYGAYGEMAGHEDRGWAGFGRHKTWWEKRQEELMDKKTEDTPPVEDAVDLEKKEDMDGVQFGEKYVLYKNRLIAKDIWDKIKGKIKPVVDEVPTEDVKGFCECGNERCSEEQLCVPCILCGGRFQADSGYCPGCYQMMLENTEEGESGKVPKPEGIA